MIILKHNQFNSIITKSYYKILKYSYMICLYAIKIL